MCTEQTCGRFITDKNVTLIEKFYDHFECSIILGNNTLFKWFTVKPGVTQGCIRSPILFLVVIDWFMRNTTSDKPSGIQWNLFCLLEDLYFADDRCLLSTNRFDSQEETATSRLGTYAKQTGLKINHQGSINVCKCYPEGTDRSQHGTTWVYRRLHLPGQSYQ